MAAKKKVPITGVRASPPPGGQYEVVSVLVWLGYFIVAAIPVVGLVMCFVWAFGKGNMNRRNVFRAALILMAAGIVLGLLFGLVFGSMYQGIIGSLLDLLG